MSSGNTIKKKVPKGALDRIGDLESIIPQLINALNSGFMQQEQRLTALGEVLDAIIAEVGQDKIQARIEARRAEVAAQKAEQARVWVEENVAAGNIELVDAIEEGCLVVGVEYDKEGGPVPPGRVQLTTDRIRPDIREKLLGKPVGEKVETEGGFFEVLEIYKQIQKPQGEVAPEEKVAPAPVDLPTETSSDETPAAVANGG